MARPACTSWLPHRWQLLQTGQETPNFNKNKKVRHVTCIEFWEEFISWFDNRQSWILAIFVIWYSIKTKIFSTKTQLFFCRTQIRNLRENAVPYKFRFFLEKRFFELTILIFVFPLTTTTCKRANSGGHSQNAALQKTTHIWALLNK